MSDKLSRTCRTEHANDIQMTWPGLESKCTPRAGKEKSQARGERRTCMQTQKLRPAPEVAPVNPSTWMQNSRARDKCACWADLKEKCKDLQESCKRSVVRQDIVCRCISIPCLPSLEGVWPRVQRKMAPTRLTQIYHLPT